MAMLRWLLSPLKRIEWQADSICNREFPVLDNLPNMPDLRRIMEAMNRMTAKVQWMLSELESLVSRLRQQAYQHPVTGLDNKRRFMDIVSDRIKSEEDFMQGAFYLVQIKSLKEYNDRKGYQAGDELLCEVAQCLVKATEDVPKHSLAHLTGADFGLLVEDCSLDESKQLCQRISSALAGLYGTGMPESPDVAHIGAAYFDGRQSLKDLLSEADMALRSAQAQEANSLQPRKIWIGERCVLRHVGAPSLNIRWRGIRLFCCISRWSVVRNGSCCTRKCLCVYRTVMVN